MRLTVNLELSLKVLVYLASNPARLATIREIAEYYGASNNHLVKVVHKLGLLGYLRSTPGRHGGVTLAQPADQIRVGDVVSVLNKNKESGAFEGKRACPLAGNCRLRGVVQEATQCYYDTLNRSSLADLAGCGVHTRPSTLPQG